MPFMKIVIGALVALVCAQLAYWIYPIPSLPQTTSREAPPAAPAAPPAPIKTGPPAVFGADALTLKPYSLTRSRFDLVKISGTFVSVSPTATKDPVVECAFIGNSGSILGHKAVRIAEIIPSNGKKSFKNITLGIVPEQTADIRCEIIKARSL